MAQALKEIIYGEPVDKNRPVDNHSPQNSVISGMNRMLEEFRGEILFFLFLFIYFLFLFIYFFLRNSFGNL